MRSENQQINISAFKFIFALTIFIGILSANHMGLFSTKTEIKKSNKKVYWLIPDGFRADRDQFNIYKWAEQGLLPNIRTLMARGSYGYSWPVFPGHTPTNFATLLTGTYPKTHGVSDGPMRALGYPVKMVVKGGFSSFAKKVPTIWNLLEPKNYRFSLQSVPGSTPPDLNFGSTIKGRWGGWGVEFPPVIFHSRFDQKLMRDLKNQKRAFNYGVELTKAMDLYTPKSKWMAHKKSFSPELEIDLSSWGMDLFGLLIDTKDDGLVNYDTLLLSHDRTNPLAELNEQAWSPWYPAELKYQLKNDYNTYSPKKTKLEETLSEAAFQSSFKVKVISLGAKEDIRIRIVFDQLNEFLTEPMEISQQMHDKIGPMIDFVDHYPPQLIYYKNDKQTFLEEANMSWKWHQDVVPFLIHDLKSDFVIHSIYTPNQMLTSRWWLPYLDPQSGKYNQVSEDERKILWTEMLSMYQNLDKLLGEAMKNMDENSYIILSSDHGVIPLNKEIRLNNLFAKKGWLHFKKNEKNNEYEIDWAKTKVVFLQMHNVYIHTQGLEQPYQRDTSPEYKKLREDVRQAIHELKVKDLRNPNGEQRPVDDQIWNWEDAEEKAQLPGDRVGDLILANTFGYNWVEDVTDDLEIFQDSLKGGYKQGVWPKSTEGMLTPFIIAGPGIKANHKIEGDLNHVDQFSTIFRALNLPIPAQAEGSAAKGIWDSAN